MGRPLLPSAPRVDADEIARRYRTHRGGAEEIRWQSLRLLPRDGGSPTHAAVAAQVGLTPAWARTVPGRWNVEGPAGRRAAITGDQPKSLRQATLAGFADPADRPDPVGEEWLAVLVDAASWHLAYRRAVPIPPGQVPRRLVPCTPELQPAETLWPQVSEAAADQGFNDLEAMEPVLVGRCRRLLDRPEAARGAEGIGRGAALNG